jgi:hypothetical protein
MTNEQLIALADAPGEYVAVEIDVLRELMSKFPNQEPWQSWLAANGSSVGKKRIARATLRRLLEMPEADASIGGADQQYASTRITPPAA